MQLAASPSPADLPSSNERLLAGFAHVGAVLGPFLVVPIVIYFLQRDKSRFVAHHALRAIMLYLGALVVVVMGVVVGLMLLSGIPGLMSTNVMLIGFVGMYGFVLLACIIYLVLAVLAAVRAFGGEMDHHWRFRKESSRKKPKEHRFRR